MQKEKFAALANYTNSPLFSDLERLVVRYAEEMTEKVQVDSRLVEELKKQLSPEAVVQLTLSIAAANFTNRFNEALGTELEGATDADRSGAGASRRIPAVPSVPTVWPL